MIIFSIIIGDIYILPTVIIKITNDYSQSIVGHTTFDPGFGTYVCKSSSVISE